MSGQRRGASENLVNWVVANAFVLALVAVAIVAAYWAKAWRDRPNGLQPGPGALSTVAPRPGQ